MAIADEHGIKTDGDLISRITENLLGDQEVQQAISDWVHAMMGIEIGTDVSDSDHFWQLFTFRLMELSTRAISQLVNHPKQEKLVF